MILQTLQNRPKPIFPNGLRCNFPYAGYVRSGSLVIDKSLARAPEVETDPGGRYWSRTASSSTTAYGLYFNSSNVNPANYNLRYAGNSIRCVVTT